MVTSNRQLYRRLAAGAANGVTFSILSCFYWNLEEWEGASGNTARRALANLGGAGCQVEGLGIRVALDQHARRALCGCATDCVFNKYFAYTAADTRRFDEQRF